MADAKEKGPDSTEPTGKKVTFDTRALNEALETGRAQQSGEAIDPTLRSIALHVLARLPKDVRDELLFIDDPKNISVLDALERATGRVSVQIHKVFAGYADEVRQIASRPDIYRQAVAEDSPKDDE